MDKGKNLRAIQKDQQSSNTSFRNGSKGGGKKSKKAF